MDAKKWLGTGLVLLSLMSCGGSDDDNPGDDDFWFDDSGNTSSSVVYSNRNLIIRNTAAFDDYGHAVDVDITFDIIEVWFVGSSSSSSAKRNIMHRTEPVITTRGERYVDISADQLSQYDYWPTFDIGPKDGKVVICMILQDNKYQTYTHYKEFNTSGSTSMLLSPRAYNVKLGRFGCGGGSDGEWPEWLEAPSFSSNY
jgi:hypothetical protein